MAIYVRFAEQKRPKSINHFLTKFYSCNGFQCFALKTFYNKECTKLQCNSGRLRSFDDLYELVKTYYPSTTLKKMMYELIRLKIPAGNSFTKPQLYYCSTMSRIRYHPSVTSNPIFNLFNSMVIDKKMPLSKYTWGELLKLININNYEELVKFYNEK